MPIFAPFIAIFGMGFVIAIIWLTGKEKRAKADAQRDVQLSLLGKFSNGEEMSRFLATAEGRKFVDMLAEPSAEDPRQKVIGLLTGSAILACLAGAFYYLSLDHDNLIIPSVVTGAVSSGLLIGALLHYFLGSKLGLIRRPESPGESAQ